MSTNYPEVKNYIAGEFTKNGHKTLDVLCPLDGKIISTVPLSDKKDLDAAVKAAEAAYPKWSAIPIKERVQVFFRYKTLLEKHLMELAELTHIENGKTIDEAKAEVEKSI